MKRQGSIAWAVHPGDTLKHEFLKPMNIPEYRLSKAIDVNAQKINDILLKRTGVSRGPVPQRTGVSADMAIRLAKFLGHRQSSG
jgi:plasmid maintenance system antidote protein VapI